jgi:hypothetical protein
MSEKMPIVVPPKKVRFIYEKLEGCEPTYVNGVQCGMSGRGELVCNFFFEYMDVPIAEIDPVEDGKVMVDKTKVTLRGEPEEGEIVLKRDIRVRLVIPAQQISSIANWMQDALKASGITVEKSENK